MLSPFTMHMASTLFLIPIFLKMLYTCVLTVLSERNSSSAISRLLLPRYISIRISRSLLVSPNSSPVLSIRTSGLTEGTESTPSSLTMNAGLKIVLYTYTSAEAARVSQNTTVRSSGALINGLFPQYTEVSPQNMICSST